MDFTAAYLHASWRCIAFSPGSTFLASVTADDACSIVVRASSTLQVVRTWSLEASISMLQWSSDGAFLLAVHTGQKEDGIVFVLSLDPAKEANDGSDHGSGWVARISSGSDGLSHATWAPPCGPKTLILFSQNHLRATLYNLVDQHISAIEGPKHDKIVWSAKQPNHFAAILKGAERDSLYVFSRQKLSSDRLEQFTNKPRSDETWKVDQAFVLSMNDAHDVLWAPDGSCLALWEGPLEYKLQIYTPLGVLRATFWVEPDSETGIPTTRSGGVSEPRHPTKRRQESVDLPNLVAGGGSGIRQVEWHPSSLFLAVGGGEEKVRILESIEWEQVACLDLSNSSIRSSKDTASMPMYGPLIAWREPLNWLEEIRARGIVGLEQASLPFSLSTSKSELHKSGSKSGISWMAWSPQGNLLAALNEGLPNAVWIFAFSEPSEARITGSSPRLLAVLQLNGAARRICWRPGHVGKLGIVCETRAVYTWELIATSPTQYRQRAEAIPVPNDDLKATQLQWSPDGQKILIASDQLFCCAFEAGED
ncbi:related to wd-repeat protein 8 [Melanopsichium pennsylvanicum]|uniref:Related to wd-repeat protein 8 n=2 Tax=Melanopsichium pennsylvanicum TaxID=63383 RepID=A0AAJ4XGU9_9BASI|nr:related to wd-repeat protein 8 [Melanopsichium pennsylvanicum 4]SNX81476.1 related to wd-repeat protein 8 [Melanopsichium pennsylvanicum]